MAGRRCIVPIMIALWRTVITHALAIRFHCDVRRCWRIGADRGGAEYQRQSKQHEAQPLHAGRRLRRIGQRINSKTVPARPINRPPIAKLNSHQVLKFS